MPRRREVKKRETMPDPRYGSVLITKFIKSIMRNGKKSIAEKVLYDAFDIIHNKSGKESQKVFEQAIENTKPSIEVRSRRVGGSTYQIPQEVKLSRKMALAIRWIIEFAQKRNDKGMAVKLAEELLDAASSRGMAVKKKEDTHKMAEANKAFAHYRW